VKFAPGGEYLTGEELAAEQRVRRLADAQRDKSADTTEAGYDLATRPPMKYFYSKGDNPMKRTFVFEKPNILYTRV
jgi:hypothetical protein